MASGSGRGGGSHQPPKRPLPTGERVRSFGHAANAPRGGPGDVCMTLHQPLASMMVFGLKRVEGRGWDSDWRGRLWIHAASLEPSPDDVAKYEAFYTEVFQLEFGRGAGKPQFPLHYPTSCLVGCVHVVDVVARETFETWGSLPTSAKLEGDSNGSGFYFLCQEQKRMVLPFQMSGQHKLWKLDRKDAERAAKQLRACEQMPIDFQGHRDGRIPPRDAEVEDGAYNIRGRNGGGNRDGNRDGDGDGFSYAGDDAAEEEEATVAAASRASLAAEEEEQVALALAMSLSMLDD